MTHFLELDIGVARGYGGLEHPKPYFDRVIPVDPLGPAPLLVVPLRIEDVIPRPYSKPLKQLPADSDAEFRLIVCRR